MGKITRKAWRKARGSADGVRSLDLPKAGGRLCLEEKRSNFEDWSGLRIVEEVRASITIDLKL